MTKIEKPEKSVAQPCVGWVEHARFSQGVSRKPNVLPIFCWVSFLNPTYKIASLFTISGADKPRPYTSVLLSQHKDFFSRRQVRWRCQENETPIFFDN
jgi:hypothetical protein